MKKRSTSTNELTGLIKRLTVIRKQHVAALDEIESTFRHFGIEKLLEPSGRGGAKRRAAAEPASAAKGNGRRKRKAAATAPKTGKRRGRKPAVGRPAKKAGKRTRGSFEITGDELILRFVRKLGCPTTEEIRRHWESEGRGGKAENNLTNLVKSGKLIRNRIAGQMRSTYSLPPSSAT
jgi:hypothetical protein